jgi:hypothetical protein
VAAVDVGGGELSGDSFLTSVDQLGLGPDALNAGEMAGLNWVTEDNSHRNFYRGDLRAVAIDFERSRRIAKFKD